jgi:hypothetical protein
MSSSATSIIRSFVVVLSALSYAAAQVPLGVQMIPNPDMTNDPAPNPTDTSYPGGSYPSNTYQGGPSPSDSSYPSNSYMSMSSSMPVETGSPSGGAPPSQYTPPPAQYSSVSEMPYSSFTGGGYSQMDCGYGYKKGYDGKCSPESWWTDSNWGCYQTTVIINNQPYQHCPPPSTVTVTYKNIETSTLTVTYTQPMPTTVFNTVTMTDVKTETMLLTKTETLPVTITSTSVLVQSSILTKTDTVKEVITDVVTKTDTQIIPTTYTSIWVKTDIIDKTNTIERTLTSTVTDQQTLTNTITYLSTSTKTDISTQLSVATSTTTQVVQESGLSGCLSKCEQYKNLQPGNGDKYNTYASPPAYTPSPTYQPYQYQNQDGGKY